MVQHHSPNGSGGLFVSVPRFLPVALVALLVASALPTLYHAEAVTQGVTGAETLSPHRYKWVDSAAPGCLAPNLIGPGVPARHSAQDPAKGCPLGWDEIAGTGCIVDVGQFPPPGSVGDNRAGLNFCLPNAPFPATAPVGWTNFFWISGIGYTPANIFINENGNIQFGSTALNCCGINSAFPRHLPSAGSPNNLLAAYWTNLHAFSKDFETEPLNSPDDCWDVPDGPTPEFGHVWASPTVQGTFPFRYVVIEWDRVLVKGIPEDFSVTSISPCNFMDEGPNQYATFQVKLYTDLGTVDVIWKAVQPFPYDETEAQPVSLGMMNNAGSQGLNYCSPIVVGQCDETSVMTMQDRAIRYYRSQMVALSGTVTINEDCTSIIVQPGADSCSAVHPSNFAWNPDYGEPDHPPGATFCLVASPTRGTQASTIPTCFPVATPANANANTMGYTPFRNYNGDGSSFLPIPLPPAPALSGPLIERYAYRVRDWETNTYSPASTTCTPAATLPQIGCVSVIINPVNDPPWPRPAPPAAERFNVMSGDSIYILPTMANANGLVLGHYDPELLNGRQFNLPVINSRNSWYCSNPTPAADPLGCGAPTSNPASMRELGQQRAFYDGATEAGLTTFKSLSAKFNVYDTASFITFPNAPIGLRITSVTNPTTVVLNAPIPITMTELPFTIDRPNISVWVGPECPGYTAAWLPLFGSIQTSDPITGAVRPGIGLDGGFRYNADVFTGPGTLTDTFRYCVYDGERYSLTPGTVRMNIVPMTPGWIARSDEYSLAEGIGNLVATGSTAPAANDDSSLCSTSVTYVVQDPGLGPPNAYLFTWDVPTSRFSYVPHAEWASDDGFWYRMVCAARTVTDATYASGSTTITSSDAAFNGVDIGASVTGPGIPAGATITAVNPPTSTISAATTAAETPGANVVITPVPSNTASVRLRVLPTNDQPFIDDWVPYGDTMYEDKGLVGASNLDATPAPTPAPSTRYVPKVITGISPGAGWEESRSQRLRVVIESVSNPALFTSTIPCPNNYSWSTAICPPGERGPALTLFGPQGSQSATLSYTAAPDAFGTSKICWRIQDNGGTAGGGKDTYPAPSEPAFCFDITIKPVNDRPRPVADSYTIYRNMPLIAPKPAQLWPTALPSVQDLLRKGVPDLDVDGDIMKAFLFSGPTSGGTLVAPGVTPDGGFQYTPPNNQPATAASPPYVDTFRYYVKDIHGAASGPTLVTVTVLWNAKPVATITKFAWTDETLAQPFIGDTITAEGTCTDADSTDVLFLLWDFGDGFTSTDASTTHAYGSPGEYTVRLLCYDSKGDVGTAFHNVTAKAFNNGAFDPDDPNAPIEEPPILPLLVNAGLNRSVIETTRVNLLGAASEPDVDAWTWTQVAGPTAILVNNTKQDAWFYAPALSGGAATSVTFSLVATKGARTALPDLVTYTVVAENNPPIARPVAPRLAHEGEVIDLTGSDSSDADADQSLTFRWSAPGFDSGLSDATLPDTTFTVPEGSLGNVITFTLEVNDGVMSSLDSVQVEVVPKLYAGDGFTVETEEDGVVTLTPVAPGVHFTWDFGDQSQETTTGATTHQYAESGTYTVWLTTQDADGQQMSFRDTVEVTVGTQGDGTHGITSGGNLAGKPGAGPSAMAWWLIVVGVVLAISLVVATMLIMQRRR